MKQRLIQLQLQPQPQQQSVVNHPKLKPQNISYNQILKKEWQQLSLVQQPKPTV
jgi:hypothetical protein